MSNEMSSKTYFTVLGLREKYSLDLQDLEKSYLAQQRLSHPDQFVLKSKEEQEMAEEQTMFLNEAYRTLKSPVLRGHYLLSLKKKNVEVLEKPQNPLFLMEMMEEREQMAQLETEEDIKQASQKIKELLQKLEKEIGEAFEDENLSKARSLLDQFQYRLQLSKTLHAKIP